MSKTDDQVILRPVSQDSPGSVSTGETPPRKMSKAVVPRDTKPDSRRELPKSNPLPTRSSKRKKSLDVLRQSRQAQNKPRFEIGVGDSRSQDFHEETYA